jgi:anti-sigma factor RsiW
MSCANCPSSVELNRLFLGGLSEGQAQILEEHVLQCPHCLSTLQQQAASQDALAGALSEKTQVDAMASSPVLDRLKTDLRSLRALHAPNNSRTA